MRIRLGAVGCGVVEGDEVGEQRLQRFVIAHLLAVVFEWSVTVGVLVHAFDWGGSTAVGAVSLAVLAPPLFCAPLAAAATARYRAHSVRLAGFAIEAVAYGGAAAMAALDAPTPAVAAFVVVGLGALNTLRPTGAALLPRLVRSARDLSTGNLLISYCDSSSSLVGPLVAAALAGFGGPTAVFTAAAAGAVVGLAATAWRPAPLARSPVATAAAPRRRVMRAALKELRARPWSIGVLGVSSARNLVVGAFDVLLVIIALDALDLGDGGPGYLSALVGGGAAISALVTTLVVRRARLRPALIGSLVTTAALCVLLGVSTDAPVVYASLPVMGLCVSAMDNTSRMLLQRSSDPRSLGPLFACLGLVAGVGQLAGSALAQTLFAIGGLEVALIGLGGVIALVTAASLRSLREADAHADVPVVEMALLVDLPMFAPLPASALEAVARAAEPVEVETGARVIEQGDAGDTFYVVSDGEFDVVMSGEHIRTARRGDFFGEVALLASVPRTATVTSRVGGVLLGINRQPFLVALTGHDIAHAAANAHVRGLRLDMEGELHLPDPGSA